MNSERPAAVEAESLPAHVAMCGLRYRDLSQRLYRVEYLLYGVLLLVALGDGSIADILRNLMPR